MSPEGEGYQLPHTIPQRVLGQSQARIRHSKARPLCPFAVHRMTRPPQLPLPNTSEGFSSSSKWPPRLVSYVAKPPSEFLMLSNCPCKQREGLGLAHRQCHHPSLPQTRCEDKVRPTSPWGGQTAQVPNCIDI